MSERSRRAPTPRVLEVVVGQPEASESPRLRLLATQPADWEAIYRDHVVPVFRYVYARVGNRPDAEDVTAQTFLRSLPRLRLTAAAGETRAYLLTAARTVLADHWAGRFGAGLEAFDDSHEAADPRRPSPPGAGADRIEPLLARLPDRYRRVLELRFLSGMSLKETAREMGITVANAKVLQLRALRRAAGLDVEGAP